MVGIHSQHNITLYILSIWEKTLINSRPQLPVSKHKHRSRQIIQCIIRLSTKLQLTVIIFLTDTHDTLYKEHEMFCQKTKTLLQYYNYRKNEDSRSKNWPIASGSEKTSIISSGHNYFNPVYRSLYFIRNKCMFL